MPPDVIWRLVLVCAAHPELCLLDLRGHPLSGPCGRYEVEGARGGERGGWGGKMPGGHVPLAKVELSVRALVDVLDLDERRVLVLVDLAPARRARPQPSRS